MANKIISELGIEKVAIGDKYSMARAFEQYDKTIPKLVQRIRNSQAWSSVPDSCLEQDLINICEDNNIPNKKHWLLIKAAKYHHENSNARND